MKTIQMTYCKRFGNSCYHHQCIANWTAVVMLQVLIGLAKLEFAFSVMLFGSYVFISNFDEWPRPPPSRWLTPNLHHSVDCRLTGFLWRQTTSLTSDTDVRRCGHASCAVNVNRVYVSPLILIVFLNLAQLFWHNLSIASVKRSIITSHIPTWALASTAL